MASTTEISFLTVLEAGSQNLGFFLMRAAKKVSAPDLCPWFVMTVSCLCLHIIFPLLGSVSKFSLLTRTPVILG
jgi:hypothetical protein